MSGNSLASLLELMKKGSVTQGWGAISTFNRGRINRLLEQQYIERFNGLDFMPPFGARLVASEDQYDFVELENISLGAPLLSFNNASMDNSTAVLTMNIIAGRYTASRQLPGAEKVILSTFNVTESQGFTLEMDIELAMVTGEIDRRGKVTLKLSDAANFRCNLAGNDEVKNSHLAGYFKKSFEALPPHRSVFQLGMLELKGYNHLTPKEFRILTQAAPGAKVRGAMNYGDGAVVVFIRLLGNTGPGRFPPINLPYLIPDDQEPNGSDKYSATLVLSEEMVSYVEENRLELLNTLLFPGENVFEERERHAPRDLAVFGNISPKRTLITLEPAFKTIKAGDTQRFTLRNWKGEVIQASKWQAVSLRSHTVEEHGTIAGGLYTAASAQDIGHDSLHVAVTAEYVNEGVTYTASALLLVEYDSMTVSPRVSICSSTAQSLPVLLKASTVSDALLKWTLLAPEYGTLTQNGNEGQFMANALGKSKGLVVQQIEATGTEARRACVVLVNSQQMLQVNPPYVERVKKGTGIQLKDDSTLLPELPRRWKVIGGEGTVDAGGLYTSSAQGLTESSVVQCEIVRNGVVFSSGYSVIDLSELEPASTWERLTQFTIKVPGGDEQNRRGSMFSNGYQQLLTRIVVQTQPVIDGDITKIYPLSVTEQASLTLVEDSTKAEVLFVEDPDGIPEFDEHKWRANLKINRFELPTPRPAAPLHANPESPIIEKEMYIHTRQRTGETKTFHMKFQADKGSWHYSTDMSDTNSKIDVTPLPIPTFVHADYKLARLRIKGGSGNPFPDPNGPQPHDDFDFHLNTVDYWSLSFVGYQKPATTFETMEFVVEYLPPINTSMIRWESEQLWETMFSWTGYYFDHRDPDNPEDGKIKFDDDLDQIILDPKELDIDLNKDRFESGTLLISLHRSDKIPYVRSTVTAREKLSRVLVVLLTDKQGNPHKRKIQFLERGSAQHRNYLEHTSAS